MQYNTPAGTGGSASSRSIAALASSQHVVGSRELRQMLGITTRTLERGLSAIGAAPDADSISQAELHHLLDHLTLQADIWL